MQLLWIKRDNKAKAVEQEEKKNIKLQKIRIDFSFKREVIFFSGYSLGHRFAILMQVI